MAITTLTQARRGSEQNKDLKLTLKALPPSDLPQDIILPQIFTSWCAQASSLHPDHAAIKTSSEEYFRNLMHTDPALDAKYVKADFPCFASTWGHDAPADRVWVVANWIRWMFHLDDLLDDGDLKDDLEGAAAMVNKVLQITDNAPQPEVEHTDPLLAIYASMWQEISNTASPQVAQRYAAAQRDCISEQLKELGRSAVNVTFTIDSYLAMRRKTIGIHSCLALSEYMYNLDIPDHVLQNETIQELVNIAIDLGSLHNDVLSWAKDQGEEFDHNIIQILQGSGNAQDGFDAAGSLMQGFFKRWQLAMNRLPSWGAELDCQIYQYVQSIQSIIVANLHWSFEGQRYFGKHNNYVRATGIIPVELQLALIARNKAKASAKA